MRLPGGDKTQGLPHILISEIKWEHSDTIKTQEGKVISHDARLELCHNDSVTLLTMIASPAADP